MSFVFDCFADVAAILKNAANDDLEIRRLSDSDEIEDALELENLLEDSNDRTGEYHGAFENGRLVGMIRTTNDPLNGFYGPALEKLKKLKPEIWIQATVVDPDHRGKGIGKALRAFLQKTHKSILTGTDRESDPAMDHINRIQGFVPVLDRRDGHVWHWGEKD